MMRKKENGNEWKQIKNLESLEAENDSYIDDLEARVQGLKELSLAMRDEVQTSNSLLGTMVGSSSSSSSISSSSRGISSSSSSSRGMSISPTSGSLGTSSSSSSSSKRLCSGA
ncbi:hypothetical protein, conserved [Eimeria tenella]|uniref:t-SNARE coiled-coil homology domain-containing protein n=1 Tax=Eimeria tenella TaxID=5802 RepID=U6L1S4_EIMTE|nr:hypothetical protein, conserved [Eimeria tenella]CDJ42534.1 hypothetical protein, conserved [Eimeria tenella]|eukprot:XP_013233284.1 hypothetical protein, conserved [Eimeria tenella]